MIEYLKWSYNVPFTGDANMIYSVYIDYWIKMTLLVWCLWGSESIEVGKAESIQVVNCAIGNLIKKFFSLVHKILDPKKQ